MGNLQTRLDANHALTRYSYYADDLLRKTEYPDATSVTRTYDPNHNLVGMTDSLGTSSWTFDALDRLTGATDALSRTLAYSYDPVGNQTGITYPDRRTVAYSHFKNNWLKTVTDPLAGVTNYQRDGVGQVTLATNPNDTVAEMTYDKANRLLSLVNRQTVGAHKTISAFTYTLDDVGQRIKIDAQYGWRNPPTVSTTYTYDPLRRLTRTDNNEGAWTTYGFDAAGNRLALSTNDDELSPRPFDVKSETYAYNDANELLSVISDTSANGINPTRSANVAQALAAFRHEVAAQRGKHITTAAADALLAAADDLIARLYSNNPPSQSATAVGIAALRSQVQAYRASGAIDSDGVANSLLVKLDKAGRANQSQTGELKTTTYTYDANGNRIGIAWPGPRGPKTQGTDYGYNFENLLIEALDYQANTQGNRVDRAVTTMSYDGLNRRLVKRYDPKLGASGIKRTEYAFDVLDPVAEYNTWNGQYNDYYRGDMGRMIAMQNFPSGQRYTYHHDGLGSISALAKAQGQSVHTYRYDPYGYIYPDNGNWTDPHNGFTFTGQEYDEETSLLHFYARDYDPLSGVWMQQDPYRGQLPEPLTLHRYGYVGGNPVSRIDPLGFVTVEEGGSYGKGVITIDGETISVYVPPMSSYTSGNQRITSVCPENETCILPQAAYQTNVEPDACMFGPCLTTSIPQLNPPKEEGWITVKEVDSRDSSYSGVYIFNAFLGGNGYDASNLVEARDYRGNPVSDRQYAKAELAREGLSRLSDAQNAYLNTVLSQRIIIQERRQSNQAICSVEKRAIIMSTNLSKSGSAYQAASLADSPVILAPHTVEDTYFLWFRTRIWRSYPDGSVMYMYTTYR